ncbi:MAG: Hsp20/alpha crystallin family protein [Candidatus Neomarinimicrobiota bacterium]
MSLIKWKPLNNEIDTFDNIIDQFFSDISIDPRFSLMNTNSVSNYYNENEKEYYLTMDVPGMSKDDIEVAFDNDRLKITGQRKSDKYDSYEYGQIEKTFNVPNNVETDKISAKIDNGVLKVLLPKAKSSLRRKITIK